MLWYWSLGKSPWQLGSYPSVERYLPATRDEYTGFPNVLSSPASGHKYKPLGLQWFRLCWCFSCLISYREKSLEMQYCLGVVVAEKGKMLKWKTWIRSVNMYLNWWKYKNVLTSVWFELCCYISVFLDTNKVLGMTDNDINVFVFLICRKTLKQDQGFIALGVVNALAWLIPIWFIYSLILFLYKNPL